MLARTCGRTAGVVLPCLLVACGASRGGPEGSAPEVTRLRPSISFTYVPDLGVNKAVSGVVRNVVPAQYKVAPFIRTFGWFNKPTWAGRLVTINADGTFTFSYTTGGAPDLQATRIVLFLMPNGVDVPQLAGTYDLPVSLYQQCVANAETVRRPTRTVAFAGRTWEVKYAPDLAGPGPNYFHDSSRNVAVDAAGRLYLQVFYYAGKWNCSEVILRQHLGYGTYRWTLASDPGSLDPQLVLGMFTYGDADPVSHNEIDIEGARWGNAANAAWQDVIQPFGTANHLHRFSLPALTGASVHEFRWQSGQIVWKHSRSGVVLHTWTYTGSDVPVPSDEYPHINLWLQGGYTVPPDNGQQARVVLSNFEFVP